jgi:hypothetical protein
MEPTNLTIEILKSIRDEVRVTNERVDALRGDVRDRVDAVRGEVAGLRGEVAGLRVDLAGVREQQVHSEIRVATEMVAFVGELRGLRDDLRSIGVRARLDDHEHRIEALENRTG